MDTAVTIHKENGAYFIDWTDPTGLMTCPEAHSCASSIKKARRVAREGLADDVWQGPFRWEVDGNLHELKATYVEPEPEMEMW